MGWWSWISFILGMLAGAFLLSIVVGVFALGARNDDIQPSIKEKKQRKIH